MTNVTHNSFYVFIFIFNSLHVSSTSCSSSAETNCVNTTSGSCHSVSVAVSCAGPTGPAHLPTYPMHHASFEQVLRNKEWQFIFHSLIIQKGKYLLKKLHQLAWRWITKATGAPHNTHTHTHTHTYAWTCMHLPTHAVFTVVTQIQDENFLPNSPSEKWVGVGGCLPHNHIQS